MIAGKQLGTFYRDVDTMEHDVVTLVVVPAVLATPPHPLAPSANNALGVDIVGPHKADAFLLAGLSEQARMFGIPGAVRDCTPMRLSPGLGGSIAGRPITIRFFGRVPTNERSV